MPHTDNISTIQERLNLSLKKIYPLAQQADEQLEMLKQAEKGKFSAVFKPDSGFGTSANRFLPYLIELSEDIQQLPDTPPSELNSRLQSVLTKIKQMHQVLGHFHNIKASEADSIPA